MAVLINADGDKTVVGSAPNYNSTYTVAMWVRPELVNGAFHEVLAIGADATSSNIDDLYISSGNAWTVRALVSGVGTGQTGGTPVANTWYHVAVVRASATDLRLYLNGAANAGPSTRDVSARSAATHLTLGVSPWATTNEFNGRIAHVKAWTAALTAAELVNEMNSIRPVRLPNLWGFWPILAGDRITDWSGNGRTLTETGTLASADDPGIPFGGSVIYPMQAAGGGSGTLAQAELLSYLRRGARRRLFAV